MEITLKPEHIQLAITLQNAIERAKERQQMSFIRIYPDGDKVHVGEIFGDAALEIQEFINERRRKKGL